MPVHATDAFHRLTFSLGSVITLLMTNALRIIVAVTLTGSVSSPLVDVRAVSDACEVKSQTVAACPDLRAEPCDAFWTAYDACMVEAGL